jgi:LysM repeat protein
LGRHSKPSRIRLSHGAATAAPTLAGVAAAFCLSPQAAPALAAAQAPARHPAVLDSAYRPGLAQLRSAAGQQAGRHRGSALPARYTVRPGDSLSGIARHFYHNPADWPALYWRNHSQVRWANVIEAGQVLRIPAKPDRVPRLPALLGPAPVNGYAPQHALPAAAPAQAAPAQAPAVAASSYSGGVPGGAFGQCVVSRESGGQAQIMNSSGHYGLYQFSASTWAAYGGNPADFGNASVAEQNQVFANALAQGGQSNWAPYDGC